MGVPREPDPGNPQPETAVKSSREARAILQKLQAQHPNADTELLYRTPFELLVAAILSAQTTDRRVNLVTPALFAEYPDAARLASADIGRVEAIIRTTGFFRAKARTITAMARALVERHEGRVPATMDELVQLPGVGRKTANIVLGHAFQIPGLAVDRHVLRVANRIGLARSDDPEEVEQQLCRLWPPASWTPGSDTLILHGRRICKPVPLCDRCSIRTACDYYRAGGQGKGPRRGGPTGAPDVRASSRRVKNRAKRRDPTRERRARRGAGVAAIPETSGAGA